MLPEVIGLCPVHAQEFYVPHDGQCPEPGCEEPLVMYKPARVQPQCEFCGRFMRLDGHRHRACLREYDRSVNPNG